MEHIKFIVVIAYPIIYIVSASFSSPEAVIAGKVVLWPVDVTLRGYKAVFNNPKIMIGFRNSIFYTVVGTLINIIMTMFCAFPLSRKEFTARNKLSAYFVFTMYFSGGLVPTYILVMKLGLINSPWAMIIPTAMSTYNMIIARTYMVNSIPDELYEATEIDGGTPWQYFIKIVWPLCKPIIAVLVLYYGVAKWNDYYNAMIFLKKDSLQPLTIVMRDILIQNQVDPTMLTDARQAWTHAASKVLHDRGGIPSGSDHVSVCAEVLRQGRHDRCSEGLRKQDSSKIKTAEEESFHVAI